MAYIVMVDAGRACRGERPTWALAEVQSVEEGSVLVVKTLSNADLRSLPMDAPPRDLAQPAAAGTICLRYSRCLGPAVPRLRTMAQAMPSVGANVEVRVLCQSNEDRPRYEARWCQARVTGVERDDTTVRLTATVDPKLQLADRFVRADKV